MKKRPFFTLADGCSADLYTLTGANGFAVDITDWGGALVAIRTPNRDGGLTDVLLGFADAAEYRANDPFFGALIGRVANRIANGRFTLDGKVVQVPVNDSDNRPNCLHGGESYGRRKWNVAEAADDRLKLTLVSPDGDAGFPGEVRVEVTYRIVDGTALEIDYRGTCDAVTVLSMTNHAYFNLNGEGARDCGGHRFRIAAERHTEVDSNLSPTGNNPPVAGTPYDLRSGRTFEEILRDIPHGFDDNFVLSDRDGEMKRNAAEAHSANTGITLAVDTTAPGIQFYMGFFLNGTITGKRGAKYFGNSAFCLEAQLWPDAVNHPEFPSARLEPGQEYRQTTIYRFGVK